MIEEQDVELGVLVWHIAKRTGFDPRPSAANVITPPWKGRVTVRDMSLAAIMGGGVILDVFRLDDLFHTEEACRREIERQAELGA